MVELERTIHLEFLYEILVSACLAAVATGLCMAQSNAPPAAANWGNSVQGVQMSITMTNSIIDSGSSIAVLAVIKNGSTNAIQVADTGGKTDFDFFLTKGAGKLYDLTPTSDLNHLRKLVTINAGEQSASTIPVPFGKNLAPGDYTLKATRFIFTKKGTFTLESNPLKVRVK